MTTSSTILQEQPQQQPLSLGLKIIAGFHIVSAIAWLIGQTGAIFFYDTIASWGLQEQRDVVVPALVQVQIGIGMADTVILIPTHAMSAYGILNKKFFGVITSWMAFAMSMFWTVLYWTGRIAYNMGNVKQPPSVEALTYVVTILVFLFAVWASWYQCRSCSKELIDWWKKDFEGFSILSTGGYKEQPLSLGLKSITGFHVLAVVMILLGQTYAIFDYDRVASWGLQEPADKQVPALQYWNIAEALDDTFIQLPLHVMAVCGIVRREFYGIICSWMAFGITFYWIMITIASNISFRWGGIMHKPLDVFGWIYVIVFFGFAVWGSWYECRSKELIVWWKSDSDTDTGVGQSSSAATETNPLLSKS